MPSWSMVASMSSGTTDPSLRVGAAPAPPTWLKLGDAPLPTVGRARLYVCGITPYDVTHLGHAATFVWADVASIALGTTGSEVRVCRNVTDVDDVLTAAAVQRGRYYDELALTQEAVFDRNMRQLRVGTPDAEPHARHHVGAVVQLAAALLAADAAYEREGTVWFRGGDVPARAGIDRDRALHLLAAYGDDPHDAAKDDPLDVAIWRPSPEGHPAWPSAWGWGRPGWHAECAAMALAEQGPSVDLLIGGRDLQFPHHAYQRAIAEAATGVTPFARAVLHVGEVRLNGEKMAKSTGNLVLIDDLLASCSPAVLRTLLIDRRHDEPWDFDQAGLDRAAARLDRLYAAAGSAGTTQDTGPLAEALTRLRSDLDVRGALDVAEQVGGQTARRMISLLRLA